MNRDEMLLKTALKVLQSDEPEAERMAASARRVADKLGIDSGDGMVNTVNSCNGVQHLLGAYRAGTLPPSRALLIEAHLTECSSCRSQFKSGSGGKVLDWSAPRPRRVKTWHPQTALWAITSAAAVLVTLLFVYRAYWQVPPGVRAAVQSIDGSAYRISDKGDRQLAPGELLGEGDTLRTSGGGHAVLRLTDGSTVEVNERSVVSVGARGNNMTIALENGAVIVEAAKRSSGHLYVKTPDCRVAVTGTVFSVNSGLKGSRVAVLQGSVHVLHAGLDTLTTAGNEFTTSENLIPEPVQEQISWSHDRDKYLALLTQFATLRKQIEQIPFPAPRYSSDLLDRVPADTVLYISVPNLGDFLSQANQTFEDQLKKSPALQEWWTSKHANNAADLSSMVAKVHRMSTYLGSEIVIVGSGQAKDSGFAMIADVKQSGLDDFLGQQFPGSNSKPGITVLDQNSLGASSSSPAGNHSVYAVVREHEAIFSNSIGTLALINRQLNAGSSHFAAGSFGKQISAAYGRGAGIILAADIHQMRAIQAGRMQGSNQASAVMTQSGIENASYLIAEHREVNGQPENRVDLQFSGQRQGIASWLASPAPIGSLNFVTPDAAIAVAGLSKDPKSIADDLIAMTTRNGSQANGLTEAEEKLQVNFRDDIAANLGGDFLLSLDGPVLPTPSWKAVIEVNNSDRLEQTLETITAAVRQLGPANPPHSITIESSDADGRRYYSVQDTATGNSIAQYTFAEGYMIVAPSRALLFKAMQAYSTGNSLANSTTFKALLPKDANENYSAVFYQNLAPVLTPLLTQLGGETASAVSEWAADGRPTVVCAWGEEGRIEAASDSRLFGFDFLTLEALIHHGNKHINPSVVE